MKLDEQLARMRTDFVLVADDMRKSGEWSEAEIEEYGASFKSAIDSGDADRINAASVHLVAMAQPLRAIQARMVEMKKQLRKGAV